MRTKKEISTRKWPVLSFAVPPRLHRAVKASAEQNGVTIRAWVTEALIRRLEDEIDAREGLAALNEPGESIPFEQVMAEYEALHPEVSWPGREAKPGGSGAQ